MKGVKENGINKDMPRGPSSCKHLMEGSQAYNL
jgi:hypothetical protein